MPDFVFVKINNLFGMFFRVTLKILGAITKSLILFVHFFSDKKTNQKSHGLQ